MLVLTHCIVKTNSEIGFPIIPILQTRKPKHREVKETQTFRNGAGFAPPGANRVLPHCFRKKGVRISPMPRRSQETDPICCPFGRVKGYFPVQTPDWIYSISERPFDGLHGHL